MRLRRPKSLFGKLRCHIRAIMTSPKKQLVWKQSGHDLETGALLLPVWRALIDEGSDTFFGVAVQHVFHHDITGIGIGLIQW